MSENDDDIDEFGCYLCPDCNGEDDQSTPEAEIEATDEQLEGWTGRAGFAPERGGLDVQRWNPKDEPT